MPLSHAIELRARGHALLLALLLGIPAGARAQQKPEPDECFGFSFGPFTPALDYAAAGHPGRATAMSGARTVRMTTATPAEIAPSSRASAVRIDDDPRDSLLILYPAWWPAGVAVHWAKTGGDTLLGTAEAFVADGRMKVPTSTVRGVRVPCGRR